MKMKGTMIMAAMTIWSSMALESMVPAAVAFAVSNDVVLSISTESFQKATFGS